jgi:hypothetical protein
MANVIRAFEKPIADLLSDKFLFAIPSYQRPYGWTNEQAGELLDDLQHARRQNGTTPSPYFLGTIVVIKDDMRPEADVVDGQQRLATLTILLAVLRDLSSDTDAREIDRFIRQPGQKFQDIADSFRVTLRDQDQPIFRRHVQELGATKIVVDPLQFESDSQRRILEVVDFYRRLLSIASPDERELLTKYIVKSCYLVIVQASDREAAYRIFAVMNDRGLDLSPTDVLKAEIIGRLPPAKRAEHTDTWELLEEGLGRERFRDLFGHIIMLSQKQKRRSSLEQAFRESQYLKEMPPEDFIEKILQPFGERYLSLLESNLKVSGHADEINRCLRRLNRLDFSDWHPAALIAIIRLGEEPAALLAVLQKIERLSYVMFLARTHVNARIRRYAEVIGELSNQTPLLTRSALELTAAENAEAVEVLDGPIYPITRIRKLLLLRLDELESDATATYDHALVSVEHVLPQRPSANSQWLENFPDGDERRRWVHRLANLVLLSRKKNAQAANMDFEEKKLRYFAREQTSAFALTSQVLHAREWTPYVLAERQERLVGRLKEALMLS